MSTARRPVESPSRAAGASLVYEGGRWERMLYQARRLQGNALDVAAVAVEGVVGEHVAAACGTDSTAAAHARLDGERLADTFAGEVFSRLYGDPAKLASADPAAPWAPVAHGVLDQLPEWEQLRQAVAGDPDFSALAASDVLSAVAPRLADLLREVEQEQQEQDGGEGPDGNPLGRQPGKGPAKRGNGPTAADKLRAALRAGLQKAQQATGERKEGLAGLAPGLECAPPTHEHPDPTRMKLAEQVAKDGRLREVLRRAGRLVRIASAKRDERRCLHAREEVVDLERGGDVARVLPSQMVGLRHSKLRILTLRSLVERTALQYRLEGKEPQGRGPIVVLLDRSGSMSGDPNCWASAVGVACVGIATREHRSATVIEFNGHVCQVTHLGTDGRALALTADGSGRSPLAGGVSAAALRIAGAGANGGTNYDRPLRLALDGLPAGVRDDRADLIFVTDGECDVSEATLADLAAQKAKGLRIAGLTVNGGSVSAAVEAICDTVIDIDAAKGDADKVVRALPV